MTDLESLNNYTKEELLARIPKEYHDFVDVFMKQDADKLPPHRPEDHTIHLIEGATPPIARKYKPGSSWHNDHEYIEAKDIAKPVKGKRTRTWAIWKLGKEVKQVKDNKPCWRCSLCKKKRVTLSLNWNINLRPIETS